MLTLLKDSDPGTGGAGRSVNPIPTGEGRLSPPIISGTPNVFHLPASLKDVKMEEPDIPVDSYTNRFRGFNFHLLSFLWVLIKIGQTKLKNEKVQIHLVEQLY